MNNIKLKNAISKLYNNVGLPYLNKEHTNHTFSNTTIDMFDINHAMSQLLDNDLYLENQINATSSYTTGPKVEKDDYASMPNGYKTYGDIYSSNSLDINHKVEYPIELTLTKICDGDILFVTLFGNDIYVSIKSVGLKHTTNIISNDLVLVTGSPPTVNNYYLDDHRLFFACNNGVYQLSTYVNLDYLLDLNGNIIVDSNGNALYSENFGTVTLKLVKLNSNSLGDVKSVSYNSEYNTIIAGTSLGVYECVYDESKNNENKLYFILKTVTGSTGEVVIGNVSNIASINDTNLVAIDRQLYRSALSTMLNTSNNSFSVSSPNSITTFNGNIYIGTDDGIYFGNTELITKLLNVELLIKDMRSNALYLYAITSNKIYLINALNLVIDVCNSYAFNINLTNFTHVYPIDASRIVISTTRGVYILYIGENSVYVDEIKYESLSIANTTSILLLNSGCILIGTTSNIYLFNITYNGLVASDNFSLLSSTTFALLLNSDDLFRKILIGDNIDIIVSLHGFLIKLSNETKLLTGVDIYDAAFSKTYMLLIAVTSAGIKAYDTRSNHFTDFTLAIKDVTPTFNSTSLITILNNVVVFTTASKQMYSFQLDEVNSYIRSGGVLLTLLKTGIESITSIVDTLYALDSNTIYEYFYNTEIIAGEIPYDKINSIAYSNNLSAAFIAVLNAGINVVAYSHHAQDGDHDDDVYPIIKTYKLRSVETSNVTSIAVYETASTAILYYSIGREIYSLIIYPLERNTSLDNNPYSFSADKHVVCVLPSGHSVKQLSLAYYKSNYAMYAATTDGLYYVDFSDNVILDDSIKIKKLEYCFNTSRLLYVDNRGIYISKKYNFSDSVCLLPINNPTNCSVTQCIYDFADGSYDAYFITASGKLYVYVDNESYVFKQVTNVTDSVIKTRHFETSNGVYIAIAINSSLNGNTRIIIVKLLNTIDKTLSAISDNSIAVTLTLGEVSIADFDVLTITDNLNGVITCTLENNLTYAYVFNENAESNNIVFADVNNNNNTLFSTIKANNVILNDGKIFLFNNVNHTISTTTLTLTNNILSISSTFSSINNVKSMIKHGDSDVLYTRVNANGVYSASDSSEILNINSNELIITGIASFNDTVIITTEECAYYKVSNELKLFTKSAITSRCDGVVGTDTVIICLCVSGSTKTLYKYDTSLLLPRIISNTSLPSINAIFKHDNMLIAISNNKLYETNIDSNMVVNAGDIKLVANSNISYIFDLVENIFNETESLYNVIFGINLLNYNDELICINTGSNAIIYAIDVNHVYDNIALIGSMTKLPRTIKLTSSTLHGLILISNGANAFATSGILFLKNSESSTWTYNSNIELPKTKDLLTITSINYISLMIDGYIYVITNDKIFALLRQIIDKMNILGVRLINVNAYTINTYTSSSAFVVIKNSTKYRCAVYDSDNGNIEYILYNYGLNYNVEFDYVRCCDYDATKLILARYNGMQCVLTKNGLLTKYEYAYAISGVCKFNNIYAFIANNSIGFFTNISLIITYSYLVNAAAHNIYDMLVENDRILIMTDSNILEYSQNDIFIVKEFNDNDIDNCTSLSILLYNPIALNSNVTYLLTQNNKSYLTTNLKLLTNFINIDSVLKINNAVSINKNICAFATPNGLYSTRYLYLLKKDTIISSLAEILNFYDELFSMPNGVSSMVSTIISSHVSSDHDQASMITLLNTLYIDVLMQDISGWIVDNNDNDNLIIKNDIILEMVFGSYIDGDVVVYTSNYLNNEDEVIELTDISYITKRYSSGVTELYINVPTTNTYYIANTYGASNCLISPDFKSSRKNLINFGVELAELDAVLSTHYTTITVGITSSEYRIDNILDLLINGNSLPLKIYKDQSVGLAGLLYKSFIEPSVVKNYNITRTDENGNYLFNFACFGTDALAIKIMFYDRASRTGSRYVRIVFDSNGGEGVMSKLKFIINDNGTLEVKNLKKNKFTNESSGYSKIFVGWTLTPTMDNYSWDSEKYDGTQIYENLSMFPHSTTKSNLLTELLRSADEELEHKDEITLYAAWITYLFTADDTTLTMDSNKLKFSIDSVSIDESTKLKNNVVISYGD